MLKKCFSYNYSGSKIRQIFFIYKFLLLKAQNKIDFLIFFINGLNKKTYLCT